MFESKEITTMPSVLNSWGSVSPVSKELQKGVLYWQGRQSLMELIKKKGSLYPGLLVQTKDWELVFIFSLQGSVVNRFTDKGSLDGNPNCIYTKQ